jgi:hypothetical protein
MAHRLVVHAIRLALAVSLTIGVVDTFIFAGVAEVADHARIGAAVAERRAAVAVFAAVRIGLAIALHADVIVTRPTSLAFTGVACTTSRVFEALVIGASEAASRKAHASTVFSCGAVGVFGALGKFFVTRSDVGLGDVALIVAGLLAGAVFIRDARQTAGVLDVTAGIFDVTAGVQWRAVVLAKIPISFFAARLAASD